MKMEKLVKRKQKRRKTVRKKERRVKEVTMMVQQQLLK